jgi:hypothetical protein
VSEPVDTAAAQESAEPQETSPHRHTPKDPGRCPQCGGPLRYIGKLPRCPTIETPAQQQRGPPGEQS